MRRPIALIGFMGAGKTTIGRELSDAALDADREIERRHGPIETIFAERGEAEFRRLEEEATLELLAGPAGPAGEPTVVSLGGGAILSPRVREALADCLVVWIDVDVETAWRRSGSGAGDRPLARDRERFESLFAERREIYRGLADAVIPSGALAGTDVAKRGDLARRMLESLATLERLPAGARLRWALSRSGSYPVYIGPGLVEADGGFALAAADEAGHEAIAKTADADAPAWPLPGGRFLISDDNVRELLRARLAERGRAGLEHGLRGEFTLPPGEAAKTLANVGAAVERMAEAGVTRADHVLALGGGVVGDLAGFCAAVYQRGVPVIQVPTTVVAQVDSAYGGKTGVDVPGAKNYIGAYHQPAAVIVDTSFLLSLPEAELAAGFVEVLKTALLAGGGLWDEVRGLQPKSATALAEHPSVIFDCAGFKCGVVAADERDGGLRQILNLGHTVGHAIEAATDYRAYRHGEAVGLGLLAALRLSEADALRDEVAEMLAAWGLPTRIDRANAATAGLTAERVVELTRRDKKRLRGDTPFVLLSEPGAPRYGAQVPAAALSDAVGELFDA